MSSGWHPCCFNFRDHSLFNVWKFPSWGSLLSRSYPQCMLWSTFTIYQFNFKILEHIVEHLRIYSERQQPKNSFRLSDCSNLHWEDFKVTQFPHNQRLRCVRLQCTFIQITPGNTTFSEDIISTLDCTLSQHCQVAHCFLRMVSLAHLQILLKPQIKMWPCEIHCLLMMLPKASCFLPLNSLRRAVYECMPNIGV